MRDRDDADLVQDALQKIWEHCSQIEFSKVKTYLFTTVNNLFLNTIKHQSGFGLCQRNTQLRSNKSKSRIYFREEEFKIKLQAAIASRVKHKEKYF
jgi:RNA polymerase sigma-70 factor (ECF subfamily)